MKRMLERFEAKTMCERTAAQDVEAILRIKEKRLGTKVVN